MHLAVPIASAGSQLTSLGWWRQVHHYVPIGLVGAISWTVWLTRFTLSRVYRPVKPGYGATTLVVLPSYREDPDILDRCLTSWLSENPTEVIVVPDVANTEVIERLNRRAITEPRLKVAAVRPPRQALGARRRHPRCHGGDPAAVRLGHELGDRADP